MASPPDMETAQLEPITSAVSEDGSEAGSSAGFLTGQRGCRGAAHEPDDGVSPTSRLRMVWAVGLLLAATILIGVGAAWQRSSPGAWRSTHRALLWQDHGHFRKVSAGTCSSNGFKPILTKSECMVAWDTLGLPMDKPVKVRPTNLVSRPEGCYFFTNPEDDSRTLWLGSNPDNVGKGAETSDFDKGQLREPLCAASSRTPAPAPASSGCGWPGENCGASKCCRVQGEKCFKKNHKWASCMETCTRFNKYDRVRTPWSCDVLGGAPKPMEIPKAPPGGTAGTSLYCFVVVSAHTGPPGVGCPQPPCPGVHTYEDSLVAVQRSQRRGVFACDSSAVFHAPLVNKAEWGSFANTDIFINIWEQVRNAGKYAIHDWTVKCDPDAVFLPDRLRQHIRDLRPPKSAWDKGVYLKNTNFKFGFMGSLEIISTGALQRYFEGAEKCSKFFGHNGGEDFYMMTCLDALGVGHMSDPSLLNDKYTMGTEACRKAGTCTYDIKDTSPCANTVPVAFHPYKDPAIWMQCLNAASSARDLSAPPPPPSQAHSSGCSKAFEQCGGQRWTGPTCCEEGCTCSGDDNGFYRQCAPPSGQWQCNSGGNDPQPDLEQFK